ncbi:hypothetical protein V7157_17310, partial [Neobacillus drentensis]|uniref:hypothetical protein n=1 Tax=Neobacillus drentensis TaxID=220684 RepID=UPI0030025DB0
YKCQVIVPFFPNGKKFFLSVYFRFAFIKSISNIIKGETACFGQVSFCILGNNSKISKLL